jgi:hypothetical protein
MQKLFPHMTAANDEANFKWLFRICLSLALLAATLMFCLALRGAPLASVAVNAVSISNDNSMGIPLL